MEMMDPFDHRNNLGKNCFGILPLGAELAAAFKRVHDLRVFEVGPKTIAHYVSDSCQFDGVILGINDIRSYIFVNR